MNLADVLEAVCRKATRSRPHTVTAYSLQKGREIIYPEVSLEISVADSNYSLVSRHNNGTTTAFSLGELHGYAGMLDNVALPVTGYGNVKGLEIFKLLYDVSQRAIPFIEAGTLANKLLDSAPCMECGLILPLTHLTVDHQRPQSGGELEAVLKAFRVCGLTLEGPKGNKGKALQNHLRTGARLTALPTKPTRAATVGLSRDNRYTLNDQGIALYSLLRAGDDPTLVQKKCMHGLINLQPLCQPCNSRRGNPLKYPG